ncbi:MAG: glycosyltransferase, partial [Chlamydiae bacterium]|nr:glycosyltransferase [Chlamydiota bacterium]
MLKHREITCLQTTTSTRSLNIEDLIKDPLLSCHIKTGLIELQKFQEALCNERLQLFQKVVQDENIAKEEKVKVFRRLPPFVQNKLICLAKDCGIRKKELYRDITVLNKHATIFASIRKGAEEAIKGYDGGINLLMDEFKKKSQTSHDPKEETGVYDVSLDRLVNQETANLLKQPLSVVMLGIEYAGLVKEGGLSEAVEGLARGLKTYNSDNRITLVFPKTEVLPDSILKSLKEPQVIKYSDQIEYKVYTYSLQGVEVHFIENKEIEVPQGHLSVYGPTSECQNKRIAAFSALAADYIQKMNKQPDIVHLHDWHVAGVGLKLTQKASCKRPAIVFTFHNNAQHAQGNHKGGVYRYSHGSSDFIKWGLVNEENANLFVSMLGKADVVNTVSETFAKEAQ